MSKISNTQPLKVVNISKWLEENRDQFIPPVCNKLLHNEQLTVMFVGGPNIREDYHIEEGEELFYQIKGDISVKILENGKHREVFIKEGELFLLPARIPHSPQRPANTIGLVVERKRDENEIDGVRWFVPNSPNPLYEKWFHCVDLGVELAPLIKGFFASEEYKTKIPQNNVLQSLPFNLNEIELDKENYGPYKLKDKIKNMKGNKLCLTPSELKLQFEVEILSSGEHKISNFDESNFDIWFWQLEGQSKVDVKNNNSTSNYSLNDNDSMLLPARYCEDIKISILNGFTFKIAQNSRLK